jgi:competence protein ComEC
MTDRYILLTILFFFRIVIGLLLFDFSDKGRQISVSGNIHKVNQIQDKCIIDFGTIIAKINEPCRVKRNQTVSVIGRVDTSLIEAIKGKKAIVDATFDISEKTPESSISPFGKLGVLDVVRNYCNSVYQRFLPKDESALLAGIVLGDKTNIGRDFYDKMVKSGTIHIAVASGYNLMLVGGTALSLLFWFLNRKWATMLTILTMSFYAALAGLEAPVLRALLMASFVYVAQSTGRKPMSVWLLILSCWMLLVWDVEMLWSVSFQLSVAASTGLIILAPFVMEKLTDMKLESEGKFLEKFGVISTVCTMILTAPIIWFAFGRFSIMGLFSNLFVLPLVPVVMVFGVFMLVFPQIFFVPTYAVLHLIVLVIGFLGS